MLHVEESGNPMGPPVLLLHGFMSSKLQWEPNRVGLGEELHLLLAEQPGHGQSPGPDDVSAYRAETILDQLDRIRSDRGIERWWMVGQSLGGAIVIRYALRYPNRVSGLVFTNSRAVFGLGSRRSNGQRSPILPDEPTREQVRALPYHPRNARRIPIDLKERMVEVADAMPLAVFRHLRSGGPWDSSNDLQRLQVPTLLINGRFEKAFQPYVQQAADTIADIQVINLDGGHSVNIDRPDEFNRSVLGFILDRP